MAIIASISGIRGTIGGKQGDNLTPIEIVKFVAAYGQWLKNNRKGKLKVILGRDARISGEMISRIVEGVLFSHGIDVVNIGLATTPTTEVAVMVEHADGGIIVTASHNPIEWNALKFLDHNGEFLNKEALAEILQIYDDPSLITYNDTLNLGDSISSMDFTQKHIDLIKKLELVDIDAITKANFTVAVDCINSVGAIAIPRLLRELGVKNIIELNCVPDGHFAHTPEPLPQNLTELAKTVKESKADIGFAVDPDVDRLAMVCENGDFFGEEYTLVAVADYVLSNQKGNTVSNLSSSRALRDITEQHGGNYFASAVGELNVVEKMKEQNAVIGGEGNGGVIYPALHYGRDALVGIALMLSFMAKTGLKPSEIRKKYPNYTIIKKKIEIEGKNPDHILWKIEKQYAEYNPIIIDGVKIDYTEGWVHVRKSNTEPIIRIYAESSSEQEANRLADEMINFINTLN